MYKRQVYEGFVAQVAAGAKRLAKPVLFVHGGTHSHPIDRPFRDGLGNPVENAVRVEGFGSPGGGGGRVLGCLFYQSDAAGRRARVDIAGRATL